MSQSVWFSWSDVTKITITGKLLKPHPYDVDKAVPQSSLSDLSAITAPCFHISVGTSWLIGTLELLWTGQRDILKCSNNDLLILLSHTLNFASLAPQKNQTKTQTCHEVRRLANYPSTFRLLLLINRLSLLYGLNTSQSSHRLTIKRCDCSSPARDAN